MENSEHHINLPKWLKELQENSWNLELLISGGAIFTLFQLEGSFVDFMLGVKMISQFAGTSIFIFIGMLGLKILTLGFLGHIVLRAFWLSLVCINFVFPRGYGKFKLSYKNPFKNNFVFGENLQKDIHEIDRAAGLIMYISVLTTLILLGFVLHVVLLITIPSMLIDSVYFSLYFKLVIVLMLIYYIDLFLFGLLRKVKYFSFFVYPFFRVFDVISLRIYYKNGLYLYSTNISKLKSLLGFTFMIVVALFLTYNAVHKIMLWPNISDARAHKFSMTENNIWSSPLFYRDIDIEKGVKRYVPSIQSEVISQNLLNLFVPYNIDYDNSLSQGDFLENAITVSIDDSLCSDLKWINNRQYDSDLLGIKCYVDISLLSRGMHILKIQSNAENSKAYAIPFWKD